MPAAGCSPLCGRRYPGRAAGTTCSARTEAEEEAQSGADANTDRPGDRGSGRSRLMSNLDDPEHRREAVERYAETLARLEAAYGPAAAKAVLNLQRKANLIGQLVEIWAQLK